MITTNMPALMEQLEMIADAHMHDTGEELDLVVRKPVDITLVDDLICDALFVEPLHRVEGERTYVIRLLKLDRQRHSGEMVLTPVSADRVHYRVLHAA